MGSDLLSFLVGRIEYVKFTSVISDYHSYLFYLFEQNNHQDKTKKLDIGHTKPKFNEKEAFDPLVAGLHGLFVFFNLSQQIRTNPRSFFIRPLIFAPNLNRSNRNYEKQLTGRCNFWHTHHSYSQTYTEPYTHGEDPDAL